MNERIRRGCPNEPQISLGEGEPRPIAVFDRDGVLNVEKGYVHRLADFEWTPGAIEAIRNLKALGYWVVIATNQSGIGRELYAESDLLALSEWMLEQAPIDAIFYCPHHPDENCPARKPGTWMLEAAFTCFRGDRSRSFMIGDRSKDIEAADAFGIRSVLYKGGDLSEIVAQIVRPVA